MCVRQVPHEIEVHIHDWEGHCDECSISRRYDPALPMCPAVDCSDPTAANDALAAIQADSSCTTTCSESCAVHYRIMRAYHDVCEEDELPMAVETGIHTYEEPCESMNCNAHNDTEACAHDDDHDHDHDDDHDDDHDHDHESCCEVAETYGFTINCTDTATMEAAWTTLTDTCTTATCTNVTSCARAYAIVQSHHDRCLHDEVRVVWCVVCGVR